MRALIHGLPVVFLVCASSSLSAVYCSGCFHLMMTTGLRCPSTICSSPWATSLAARPSTPSPTSTCSTSVRYGFVRWWSLGSTLSFPDSFVGSVISFGPLANGGVMSEHLLVDNLGMAHYFRVCVCVCMRAPCARGGASVLLGVNSSDYCGDNEGVWLPCLYVCVSLCFRCAWDCLFVNVCLGFYSWCSNRTVVFVRRATSFVVATGNNSLRCKRNNSSKYREQRSYTKLHNTTQHNNSHHTRAPVTTATFAYTSRARSTALILCIANPVLFFNLAIAYRRALALSTCLVHAMLVALTSIDSCLFSDN